MKITFEPATDADVLALYGAPFPVTIEGFVITVDGSREGMIGYYPEGGRWVMFARFTDRAREAMKTSRGLRTFLREARRSLNKRANQMPVVTWCDRQYERAEEFLQHLGFKPTVQKEIYRYG